MTRILMVVLVAAMGCGGGEMVAPPPPGDLPPGLPSGSVYHAADFGITGVGNETVKLDSALRVVALRGGTLDLGGLSITANLTIPGTPNLIGQVRNVRITNCMGSVTAADPSKPVLKLADSVPAGYFIRVDGCLLIGTIDYSRLFNARFSDVWVLPAPGRWAYEASGQASYNLWDGGYIGGPLALRAVATGGLSSGPNANHLRGVRIQGTVEMGAWTIGWSFTDNTWESCGARCLWLGGSRMVVRENWMEGGVDGIVLGAGSDGWIYPQVWSSFSGLRIRFDAGADPSRWVISPQKEQN